MKKSLLFVLLLFSLSANAQTTIFSENIGSGSGTQAITATTFQNTGFTFTGSGDTRTSTVSDYGGASGGKNVFLTNTNGTNFQIAGISTVGYTNLVLSFGAYKSTTASNMSELSLQYSTDGSTYTTISIPAQATGTGTAIWRMISSLSLPVGANEASNLRLRWTNTSTGPQFRIDDITLTGTGPKYWDTNGATAGVGGSATWGTTFSTNSGGTSASTTASSTDPTIFNATSGTVTLAASQTVASVTLGVSGYTFATSGTGTRTLTAPFSLSTFNVSFAPISGSDLTLPSVISGSGTITHSGTGVLELTAQNTYTGLTTVSSGTMRLNRTGGTTIPTGNSIVVNNGATMRISTAQQLANVTVDLGGTLIVDAALTITGTATINGTFQINSGGFASGGTWTYGSSSTLVYNHTGSTYGPIDSGHSYWPASNSPRNVTVQGSTGHINLGVNRTVTGIFQTAAGVTLSSGAVLTLNGTCQINSGGFFNQSPTYGSSSTLIYNTTYGTSNEWTGGASTSVTAGSGIPANVTVQSGTLTLGGGRGVPGNITVNASTTLALNATSGDLYLGGNFAMNGTLTNNNRAVFFVLGNAQSISSSNANVTFDWLLVDKTGGTTVTLGKPVIVNNTLTLTAGFFDLAINDMTVGATSGGSSTSYVRTSSTGQLRRIVTSSAVSFPVGNSVYNPITLTNSGTSDTYGIRVVDGNPANAADATKTVLRSWYITEAIAGGSNLTPVVAQYNTSDIGGSYSGSPTYMGFYNASSWTQVATTLAGSNPFTATSTGTNQFPATIPAGSYIAIGKDGGLTLPPPTITASGGVVASSPGSGTSGYVGNTVTINGTNLNSVTVVKVGGSGGTTVSILSQTATTLTFAAINLSGQIYVQNSGGNATSTESYSNLGYITTATGAWSTAGTWLGGAVPTSATTTDVTIAHNVTSTTGTTNVGKLTINGSTTLTITAATSVNINTASTNSGTITNNGTLSTAVTYTNSGTMNINGTFQINQGGFASGGTWTYGASSTLVYNNTSGPYGSIDAAHSYWPASSGPVNVTVQGGGGINMGVSRTVSGTFLLVAGTNAVQGTALTLNGTTQINGGNFQTTPTFGSSSTLIYNFGGVYAISNEWTGNATTAGSGIPFNVTIQNGTTLTFPTTNRGIGGNFNVASGGATLNATSGDLYVGGNFTNNGTFTHNTRAVFLNGTTQTLGGSNINGSGTTNCFPYLILQNGTNVTLAASAAVTNTLTLTSGKITLSTFDFNLGTSAISGSSSSNYIVTNSTGQLKRTVTSSAVLFPVGNSAYNPITFTNAGTSDIYGIRVVDGAPANAANSLFTVQRSWYITEAVAGNSDLTPVVAQYSSGEVGANYNAGITPYMGLFNGTSWTQVATTLGGSITATSTSTNQFPATIPAGSYIAIGKDAGLTSTPPTISSFSSTSGYSGSSIVITGTNFTGATAVSFGGTAAASFTVNSATQITAVVGSGGTSGSVSVTTPSGSVSLAGFTYLGFITTSGATNWNTGSSWLGGAVPTANSAVTIAHNVSIAAAFTNSPIASITVNTGITSTASATVAIGTVTNAITTLGTGAFTFTGAGGSINAGSFVNGGTLSWSAAATLNISAGGTLTNNGTFTRGTGTVNFIGSAGTINGSNAISFNNLTINSGELTLTTVPTIDGTLQLNGGYVSASPIYTSNSTLYYNLSYNRFNEWSATGVGTIGTTAGYPYNVTINTGTFDIVNGSNTARALNGTLTVNTGATFNVNALNAALTIGGGLTTVGTGAFNMGSTNSSVTVTGSVSNAGSLTLSSTSGSDLYVAGNFTNNGTFTHNTRAVFLNGTAQTISGSALNTSGTTNCFDYLFIQNNSQVTLGAAVAIRSNLTFTSGDIILSTFNLTLASGATITGASSSNYVITNNTGMLVRTLTTSTAVTFPIGNSAYNPITISQSGASDVYSFRMIDGSISGLSPNDVTRTINRNWSANRTSSSNVNITVSSISYNTGEENNATNFNAGTQPYYGLHNGTSWVQATSTQASQTFTSANTVASSTATSFSIAMGKDLAFLLLTPTITTTAATTIATTTASSGGSTISAGGGTITSKGVAYATTANPTTPSTSDGSGTADFSSSLSGLTPNTVYNYRAFATNSFGVTGYGSSLSFTTLHNAPTVGSGSGATQTAINANWTAPAGGGAATFTFEVAISTASDFSSTLSSQTAISSGTLTYQFTGLTAGTTYYFRVRANNAGGSSAWSAISSGYATLSDAMQLTALGTAATENFNTLASSGTSSTMPTGWRFLETDTNADGLYSAGTGSSSSGDTYSFGVASNSDRALGGLRSGTLLTTIGVKLVNNTGSTVNNLFVSYTGETWRVGAASRIDRLDFQYSLNATSLSTGTWTDVNALDYANIGQATGSGSLQHSASISDVISGLTLVNGSTIWFRWNDPDATSSDDGMGIDDISIKPCGTVSAPTASDQGFCSSASATVANLVATGTSIQWYSASTGGTALASNTPLVTGTTYYATQTLSGCENATRTSVAVTITTAPNAGTLSGTQAICSNGSTTFTTNGNAGGAWTSGSTGVATVNNSTGAITPVAAGTSTITYTVTGTGGCSNATASRSVTVTTAPNAGTLSGTQAICSNGSTTFTSNGDAGSWTSGSTGVATINSSTGAITPVAAGTSTITYTVTGTGGCSNATATRDVTVTTAPNAGTLSGTQAICSNGSTTFTSNGDTGSWTSGSTGVATINSSTGAITPVAAGTSTITYTVTGTEGCSNATATRDVTVTTAPNAGTLSGTQAICSTGSTTFTTNGNSGGAWTSGSTGVATVNSSTGAIAPVAAGTSTITYTVTGTGGCSNATSTRDVTVTSTPNAGTLSGTQAICSTGSTTFTTNGNSGGAWTSGSTGVATVNSSTGAITPVAAGTSTITYTVTGTGGCSNATATRDVTITTAPNAGTLSGTQAICSNGSTTFTSNGDAGSWTSGSTGVATINSSTGAITPVAAGTSTITYTVTGTGGCSNATATRDVTVTTAPDSPTGSASQSFCSASSPTIANLSATGTSIQWYAASSGGSALSSSSSLSDGSIYYASQTTSGCESTSRFAVTSTVTTNPSAPTGSASQSFCSASSPTIASLNATGTSIQWYAASSGGSALSSSSSLSDGSIYYASQTTSGCESSSRFAVTATVTASGTWIGDSNDNWNDANNWCGGIPNSNSVVVSIPSGVTVNLDFSASVLDLTIASGSTLNMGGNTISIADGGSFSNDGTFNAGTGTISFSGNGSISGSSTTFNSLIVNGVLSMNTSPTVNGTVTINVGGSISSNPVVYGSSASLVYNLNSSFTTTNNEWPTSNSPRNVTVQNNSQVTLNSAKEIAGNLNLTNGIINSTSTNLLTIGSNTATLGSINWTSGTIIGPVKRWFGTAANSTQASGIFPVGIAGQNRLAIINFTQTTDGGYILMEYKTGAPNNSTPSNPFGLPMSYVSNGQTNYIQNADLTGYWDITPYSATGVAYDALDNNTFDITLRINSDVIQANPVTANPPGMRIIRAKGNPSAPHDPFEIGATAAIITQVPGSDPGEDFFVRSNGLTGFSWFNIGGDNETPLPVELLSFTGNCDENQFILNWSTASEHQSAYFEVEKSRNGTDWTVVKTIFAAGYSMEKLDYSFVDDNSKSIESYYRLRQVDENGESETFNTILVSCDENSEVFKTLPNPSASSFQVLVNDKSLIGKATINMVDNKGTIVSTMNVEVVDGVNVFFLNENVAPGIYYISISNGMNSTEVIKHSIR